jgi:ribosomal protein L37E
VSEGEHREEHFVCERCGASYAWEGKCTRCELPLADATRVPEWQRTTVRTPREYEQAFRFMGFATGVLVSALYAAFMLASIRDPTRSSTAHTITSILIVLLLLAAPKAHRGVGGLVRRYNAERRTRALAVMPIASAPESGPVRIVGKARAIRVAHNPEHPPCLAFEQHTPAFARTPAVYRSNGGEFEIDDGSGVLAFVRAEHLHIVGGEVREGQIVVPLDATVEVIGDGVWELSTSESVVSHSRSAARVLRVEGTEDRPLLLRVVPAASAAPAPTGVRVSAAEPSSAEPDEPHSTEVAREDRSVAGS